MYVSSSVQILLLLLLLYRTVCMGTRVERYGANHRCLLRSERVGIILLYCKYLKNIIITLLLSRVSKLVQNPRGIGIPQGHRPFGGFDIRLRYYYIMFYLFIEYDII